MPKVTPLRRRSLPQEWPEAREELDVLYNEWPGIRTAVDRNTWIMGGLTAVAMVVFSAAVYILAGQINRVLAVAPVSQQERVAAIADVLGDIPDTPMLRLQSGPYTGAPTVRAIQSRLPTVRGITGRERNQACDSSPGLCWP